MWNGGHLVTLHWGTALSHSPCAILSRRTKPDLESFRNTTFSSPSSNIRKSKFQSTMQQERMSTVTIEDWAEKWERWEDRIAEDGSEMFESDFKLIFTCNTKVLDDK